MINPSTCLLPFSNIKSDIKFKSVFHISWFVFNYLTPNFEHLSKWTSDHLFSFFSPWYITSILSFLRNLSVYVCFWFKNIWMNLGFLKYYLKIYLRILTKKSLVNFWRMCKFFLVWITTYRHEYFSFSLFYTIGKSKTHCYLQTHIFHEHKWKNLHQNISKLNVTIYKKYTSWSSEMYSSHVILVQHLKIK